MGIAKRLMNGHIDPIGVKAKIPANIALQQFVAIFIEQSVNLMNGNTADQNAQVVHVLDNCLATQGQCRIDFFAALQNVDDGVMIEMDETDLVTIILFGRMYPIVGLAGPFRTIVAQNK